MSFLYSLKRALTFNFLLVASIPVLLFGLINIDLVADHQLEGVRERNVNQALGVAEDVEAFLSEVRSDLQHVKQTIASGKILLPESIDDFLSVVVGNSQFFESAYLIDKNFVVLNLGVTSKLLPRRDDYASLDFSGHPLFRMIDQVNGSVWSDTFISVVTGEPSVTLGMPMPNGYLLGNIRLSSLNKLLGRYANYNDVELAIVDAHGSLIAHSVSGVAMQRLNYGNHPTIVEAMQGDVSTQEFKQDAAHYLESAVPVDISKWVVWVGLDMNKVQEPIRNTRNLLVGIMLVAIALAAFISILNVRRLMEPLTALGRRAGEIADGNYEFSFRPSGFVEIDALAGQITNMTHAIRVREESIVANEERFRGLVNSIDGIVWEMEFPSMQFLFVSKQAESMLGFPLQDWYETPDFWQQKTHPEDVEQAKAYCHLMAEKHEDHSFEYRMIAADNRVIWIRDLVTVVVEDGRPARLLGVMLDISEEKALLDELSRSEENYREIFNASSDAIFIHDASTGQVVDVNRSMLKMFNCSYEDAISGGIASLSEGHSPYSGKEALAKLREAEEKGSCTFEWRSRKVTGELFWSEVYLRSADVGGKQRIIAAVRDISERKDAVEKVREANERLLLLIDRMPLGCIFWTPDFTVDIWNPAAEAIFGFSQEEMRGLGPYETILPAEVKPVVEVVWSRLMAGDKTAHSENENITKERGLITCEWYNTPVHDGDGKIIGVISMVQDISERKASERELESYRVHLEELVEDRTRELQETQKQLVQNERLAVLGQLTATVSHEIRNPLGTVANSLYLLKETLKKEGFKRLERPLQLAERNVERCDAIISDLLDFSRQRKIKKESLEIDSWIKTLLSELSFQEDVTCCLELEFAQSVTADIERLRRVMVNVITNALQALDEKAQGEKHIHIKTRRVDHYCEILVQDNGVGMTEEVLAKIYEPMFSTKNFGVGLGVPIIKSILEGHGGTVEYQSKPGEGTTVAMRLPLEKKLTD